MTLALLFCPHPPPSAATDPCWPESLEAELRRLLEAGRASWPQIEISAEEFVQFLAKQLPPQLAAPAQLTALRAGDLYLICALGLGHREAMQVMDAKYMPQVHRTLLKLATPEPVIADTIQILYGRLLERQNAPADAPVSRRGYAGRGELTGWLCTCAVHEAGRRYRRANREVAIEEAPVAILLAAGKNPEWTLINGQLKECFETAFREAVAALTSRERNLLRYHLLSGLSIDQISTLYHVHRATAARWVAQARERVTLQTRQRFLSRVPMRTESLPRIMELIRSQLELDLAALLKQTAEFGLPAGRAAEDK